MNWLFARNRNGQPNHRCMESDEGGYMIAKYRVGDLDKYVPWHNNELLLPRGQYAKSFEAAKAICEGHYANSNQP